MTNSSIPAQFRLRRGLQAAFTLSEVSIAAAVLAVFACASLITFTQMNRFAANARLRTLAMAVAQQKVDQIQTAPWVLGSEPPAVITTSNPTPPTKRTLVAGTVTEPNLPLDNDNFNTQAGLSSPYTNLDLQVTATRTTVLTYPGGTTGRTVAATVTVTYTYRGKSFSAVLTTLRSSDTI